MSPLPFSDKVHIELRSKWLCTDSIYLLGPGGAGKSTLGPLIARELAMPSIDLDHEFCRRVENIGEFIARNGYATYRAQNLELAQLLVAKAPEPFVFIASSGFLAAAKNTAGRQEADRLIKGGYRIVLVPSLDISTSTSVIVERQLKRGYGLQRDSEEKKSRERFEIYCNIGDAIVASFGDPNITASLVVKKLNRNGP